MIAHHKMKSKKEMRAEALAKAKAWHDGRSLATTTVSTPPSSTTSKSKVLKTSPAPASFYTCQATINKRVAPSPHVQEIAVDAPPVVAAGAKGSLVDQGAFTVLSGASMVVSVAATLFVWGVTKVVSIAFWVVELAVTAAIEEFNRDPK